MEDMAADQDLDHVPEAGVIVEKKNIMEDMESKAVMAVKDSVVTKTLMIS